MQTIVSAGIICAYAGGPNAPTGSVVEVNLKDAAYVGFNVAGTWQGTMQFEITFDGITWQSISLPLQGSTNTAAVSSITSTAGTNKTGFWATPLAGMAAFNPNGTPPIAARVRCSTFTSGSPIVTAGASSDNTYIDASLGVSSLWVYTVSGTNASVTAVAPSSTVHAWAVTHISVDWSGTATGPCNVIVYDGTVSGTILFKQQVALTANTPLVVTLPKSAEFPEGGVRGTVGNAMTVVITAGGTGITSNFDVKFTSGEG